MRMITFYQLIFATFIFFLSLPSLDLQYMHPSEFAQSLTFPGPPSALLLSFYTPSLPQVAQFNLINTTCALVFDHLITRKAMWGYVFCFTVVFIHKMSPKNKKKKNFTPQSFMFCSHINKCSSFSTEAVNIMFIRAVPEIYDRNKVSLVECFDMKMLQEKHLDEIILMPVTWKKSPCGGQFVLYHMTHMTGLGHNFVHT